MGALKDSSRAPNLLTLSSKPKDGTLFINIESFWRLDRPCCMRRGHFLLSGSAQSNASPSVLNCGLRSQFHRVEFHCAPNSTGHQYASYNC